MALEIAARKRGIAAGFY